MLAEADPTSGGTGEEFIAGFEYAGEIASLGPDSGDWKVGDPVMGTFPSAFAEYLVSDHRFVLPRPEGVEPHVACALPTALLTEFGALTVAEFEPGQSVLITGASTGIGMIGIQIAKVLRASRIVATEITPTSRPDSPGFHRRLIGSRGHDSVLDPYLN